MDTAFEFKMGIGPLSLNEKGNLAKAPQLGFICPHAADAKALCFCIHAVHAIQHGGKQRRFLTTCARTDLQDHVAVVVGVTGDQRKAQLLLQLLAAKQTVLVFGTRKRGKLCILFGFGNQLCLLRFLLQSLP